MKTLQRISVYFLALLLIVGSAGHLFNPKISDGFIPAFIPKQLAHIVAFAVELSLGILILIPKYRRQAAWGIVALMLLFLPFHLVDLFKDTPIIGSKTAAYIRVPVQLLFIYLAYMVAKKK